MPKAVSSSFSDFSRSVWLSIGATSWPKWRHKEYTVIAPRPGLIRPARSRAMAQSGRTLPIPAFACWMYQQVGFGCREAHQGVRTTWLQSILLLCWMGPCEAHRIQPTISQLNEHALYLFAPELRAPIHRPAYQANESGLSLAKRTLFGNCLAIPDCLEL